MWMQISGLPFGVCVSCPARRFKAVCTCQGSCSAAIHPAPPTVVRRRRLSRISPQALGRVAATPSDIPVMQDQPRDTAQEEDVRNAHLVTTGKGGEEAEAPPEAKWTNASRIGMEGPPLWRASMPTSIRSRSGHVSRCRGSINNLPPARRLKATARHDKRGAHPYLRRLFGRLHRISDGRIASHRQRSSIPTLRPRLARAARTPRQHPQYKLATCCAAMRRTASRAAADGATLLRLWCARHECRPDAALGRGQLWRCLSGGGRVEGAKIRWGSTSGLDQRVLKDRDRSSSLPKAGCAGSQSRTLDSAALAPMLAPGLGREPTSGRARPQVGLRPSK